MVNVLRKDFEGEGYLKRCAMKLTKIGAEGRHGER